MTSVQKLYFLLSCVSRYGDIQRRYVHDAKKIPEWSFLTASNFRMAMLTYIFMWIWGKGKPNTFIAGIYWIVPVAGYFSEVLKPDTWVWRKMSCT